MLTLSFVSFAISFMMPTRSFMMLTRSLIRTSVMRYISLLIARLPALFHGRKPIVIALTSTVIKGQTLAERLIKAVSQFPVAAAARYRRLRADILRLDTAANALAVAHRLEAIGVPMTTGVTKSFAFPLDAIEVEAGEIGTTIADGFGQSTNLFHVHFDAAAGLLTFVQSEELVSIALTTAVTQRLTGQRLDVVVEHGDVVMTGSSDFG